MVLPAVADGAPQPLDEREVVLAVGRHHGAHVVVEEAVLPHPLQPELVPRLRRVSRVC